MQKRWSYTSGYTYAIQSVLWNLSSSYQSLIKILDGKFGDGTEKAVKAFQEAEGIGVDGKVGPDTWAKLQAKLVLTKTETSPLVTPLPNSVSEPYAVAPAATSQVKYYKVGGSVENLFIAYSYGLWKVTVPGHYDPVVVN